MEDDPADAMRTGRSAPLFSVFPTPVLDVAEKSRLFCRTDAAAADMESHLVAEFAARNGLRLAVLRVISDPAGGAVPPVALAGLRADGSSDAAAVLKGLARAPGSLASLARVAAGTLRARRALLRARRLLGPGLGLADFG